MVRKDQSLVSLGPEPTRSSAGVEWVVVQSSGPKEEELEPRAHSPLLRLGDWRRAFSTGRFQVLQVQTAAALSISRM